MTPRQLSLLLEHAISLLAVRITDGDAINGKPARHIHGVGALRVAVEQLSAVPGPLGVRAQAILEARKVFAQGFDPAHVQASVADPLLLRIEELKLLAV